MSAPQSRVVADRYRLVEPLGQGGMGRVWMAWDELLHRDVAIKELIPPAGLTEEERQEMRERAMREARAIARLSHPNVVRIFDILRTEGEPWIVMEYVRSRSLQDVIAQDGPLPAQRVAEIGLGMLAALKAAHRAGVVHRDIKPGNVLLGDNGRVVLTDFGLATVPGDPVVTRTGLVLGSPAYISPERAHDGTAGPPADMWSLGATLYAAVEGQSPYARPSAIATLAALATEPPRPARRAGPLKPVFNGLLRKNPVDRIRAEEAERLLLRAAGRRRRSSATLLPSVRRPFAAGYLLPPSTPSTPAVAKVAVPPQRQGPGPDGNGQQPDTPPEAQPVAADRGTTASPTVDEPALDEAMVDEAALDEAMVDEAAVDEAAVDRPGSPVQDTPVGEPATSQADSKAPQAATERPAGVQDPAGRADVGQVASDTPGSADGGRDARTVVVNAGGSAATRRAAAASSAAGTESAVPAETADGATVARAETADDATAVRAETADDATAVVAPRSAPPADRNDQGRRADNLARAVPITLIPGLPDPTEQDPARTRLDPIAGADAADQAGATAKPATDGESSGVRGFWDRGLAYRLRAAPPLAYAVALVVVLLAVFVVVLVTDQDGDRKDGTTVGSTPSPGPATPSPAASTEPPAARATPSPADAPTSAAPPGGAGFTLPRGWRMHADPTGFKVAVPPGSWRLDHDGTIVYFRERGGQGRVLGIDRSDTPKSDPVRDWTQQEADRSWTKPNYRRVRIAKVDYFRTAADWEYVYGSGSNRLHAINRGFVTAPDQAHAILWITPDSVWQDNLDEFDVITKSFRPIP